MPNLKLYFANVLKFSMIFLLQVVGAKVVTNAKSPGARCYGFVTMSSTEEATKCISDLHRTELHGRMISVERVGIGIRLFALVKKHGSVLNSSIIIHGCLNPLG